MVEEWRVIENFPSYAVSNMGRVKRIVSPQGNPIDKILKPKLNQCGYPIIRLTICGKEKIFSIHQLVLNAFVSKKPEGSDITANHKDGCKTNNIPENLEWCTRRQNLRHAFVNGLMHVGTGVTAHASKLKSGEAWLVWKLLDSGVRKALIAKMFKLHLSTVYLILKRERYIDERV